MEHLPGQTLCQGPEPERTHDDPVDAVDALLRAARSAGSTAASPGGGTGVGVVTVAADGGGVSRSYGELLDDARRLLTGLRARGLRPGEPVVLCGLPLDAFFTAFWACVLGGAPPAAIAEHPAPDSPTFERLLHTAELLDSPLVLTDAAGAAVLTRHAPRLRVVNIAECVAPTPALDHVVPAAGDTALLMLSSGSTGAPKAVRLTHGGLADFAASTRRLLAVDAADTLVNWLPVDHSGAFLIYHLLPVFTGSTGVHAPTEQVLAEPLRWLELLHEYRAQHGWAPTFAYQLVVDALADRRPERDWDLTGLKSLVCGGERVALPVLRDFVTATARYGVREEHLAPVWGMAETVTAITWGRLDRPGTVHRLRRDSLGGRLVRADAHTPDEEVATFVASGSPAHGVTLRVVGDDGSPTPAGRIGRLQLRAPARVTPGYVANPEADAAAFPDGPDWLDTGDLAFLDADQVVITGRRKDILVLNGHNVSCHEVEEAAEAVRGVRRGEVAACGVPHPTSGTEELVLCHVSRGAEEDRRIATELRETLYGRLRLVVSRTLAVAPDAFPRTPAGKVKRQELRDRLVAEGPAPEPAPDAPALTDDPDENADADAVAAVVREEVRALVAREVDDELPFYELGLTSVLLARLRARLAERLEMAVPQTAPFAHPTVRALAAQLARSRTPGAAIRTGTATTGTSTTDTSTTGTSTTGTASDAGGQDAVAGSDRRLAVVGMSLRFPDASSPERFWANLRDGVVSLRTFDDEQLASAGVSEEQRRSPDLVPVSGVLDDVEAFDAEHFGISPKEARLTHPAHRLFLECCHQALEDGGYAGTSSRARVAVFAGSGMNLYDHQLPTGPGSDAAHHGPDHDPDTATEMQTSIGQEPDFLATRVAYRLGLRGPAVGVRTACSSSLVAVHLAGQAVLAGDADLALAGAAAVHLPQESGYRSSPGSILSPTGRCRPFDAEADGTVGGNGVAVVLLKRLDRALADGDTVHAVIRGSAVNNDGADKVGFSAPGVPGQIDVVRQALRQADVPAETLGYVEAHGTGTQLGDPVELAALGTALGQDTDRTGFCAVGSVKPHIGHLDSCAGMAGLIKTILCLRHRTLVPTPGLTRPHPELNLDSGPLTLVRELRPWPVPDGVPRRAGVSALGVGGTNAHVVLEEAPRQSSRPSGEAALAHPLLLPVSARTPEALTELTASLRDRLRQSPAPALAEVAATLAHGRPHHRVRATVVGRTTAEVAEALDAPPAVPAEPPGPLVWAFAGQGSPRPGMAAGVHAFPPARRTLESCARLFAEEFGGELLPPLLTPRADQEREVWDTGLAQVALFSHQAALVDLWRACGVEPALLLGHSVGEYAALYAAGALTLADGLRLAAWRGRLMRDGCAPGGMLAIRADLATARRVADASGAEVASVNGPRALVLSGAPEALAEAELVCAREGLRCRRLPVDRAFHSAAIEPVLADLRERAGDTEFGPLRVPLVSGVDGEVRPVGWRVDADYLCRQARQPVRFDLAMATAIGHGGGDFVEFGAGRTLTGLGRHCAPKSRWLAGQGEGTETDQVNGLLDALGSLYRAGAELRWDTLVGDTGRVPLPGHPLRRHPIPYETAAQTATGRRPAARPVERANTPEAPAVDTELLTSIRQLTANKLGRELTEVTPDSSFFELGADSLSLMGMTAEIRQRHDVRVPVRELFDAIDTPRKLAERVRPGAGSAQAPPQPEPVPAPEPVSAPAPPAAAGETPREPERPAARPEFAAAPPEASSQVHAVLTEQLRVTEQLVQQVGGLLTGQLEVLRSGAARDVVPSSAPAPESALVPAPVKATTPVQPVSTPAVVVTPHSPASAPARASADTDPNTGCDFSLYFFGDYPEEPDRPTQDRYGLIMEAAEFADQHGFHALWFPERHFNFFGSLFPNPSVLAAALAARTERIRLQAGSVVLPLHHSARVAEEWSVVDNISGGRAGLCFASGWHAKDFALAPQHYGRHREVMYEQLEEVRTLWSGASLPTTAGDGSPVDIQLHPRPVQPELPMYVAVVSNPDSYRKAAEKGLGVVTNLMTQTVEDLAENIALYRRTRAEHGLDPAGGRVVVLVHTYLGEDAERARAEAYRPFLSYLRSSLALFNQVTNSLGFDVDLDNTPEEDVEFLLSRAYERYCASRALIGDEHQAREVVRGLVAAGADEVACFVDFGVPRDHVMAALPLLDRLRRQQSAPTTNPAPVPVAAPAPDPAPLRSPLTPAERRIWFLEQLHPHTSMYHEPKAIRLQGPLDEAALRRSLGHVTDRHPALRTVFGDQGGVPYKEVRAHLPLDCPPVEDHQGATEAEALRAVLETEGRRVFDLERGPLVSARLLRLSDEEHLLFLLAHHLVFDSSSTTVLVRDLAAHYRALTGGAQGPPLPPPLAAAPPPTPPDAAEVAASLDFWRRELAGVPDLTLPTDRPRPPVRSGEGASLGHTLDGQLLDRVSEFAGSRRATPFMAITSAIGTVLGRFSGQRDLVVGTAVAARPPGTDEQIGFFLDTVPLRLDLSGDPDFATLLRRVRDASTDAYEHRDVPFDELVGALNPHRDPGRNPLFQVLVEYEREGAVDFAPPELHATLLDMPSARAPFDLSIYLTHHDDGVRLMVEYDTALFDASTVRRLVEYVELVLRRGVDGPDARLTELTDVSESDRETLDQLGAPVPPPAATGDTLHGLFLRQAERTPRAVALIDGEQHVSYSELAERVERLAELLRSRGAVRGTRVALLLPRGPSLLAALLGTLASGAAYVPLDPSAPTTRLAELLEDAGPVLLLSDERTLRQRPELADGPPVLTLDADGALAGDVPHASAEHSGPVRPEDAAYLLYTSGSTGRPKGVVVPHRGPVNLVHHHLATHAASRTLQWTSPVFDVSVQEIFTTLASGAALVLLDDADRHDPALVAEVVRRHGVGRLFMPYTPLKYLLESGVQLPSLRELFSAGEALELTRAFRRFLAAHPHCTLHNQYGPTEASVIVTSQRVDPEGAHWPPIGRPIPGARVHLLDEDGRPLPVGAVGEIHLSGPPVAYGYHARPAETATAFLDDGPAGTRYRTGDLGRWNPDGTLQYRGRVDDQTKIRGHRVEPGEVQAVLTELPEVQDAAVLPHRDQHGEQELVAYVVPAGGPVGPVGPVGPDTLRAALAGRLPDQLVPRYWVLLERLPVNASGKLDRAALPTPAQDHTLDHGAAQSSATSRDAADEQPDTALEKAVHDLWCAEFGRERLGVNHSFFDLGGHSLSAIRLLNRVSTTLDVSLTMADFFRTPTIRGIARAAEQHATPTTESELPDILADLKPAAAEDTAAAREPDVVEAAPMPATMRRLWLRHHERTDPSVYNITHRIDLDGPLDPEDLQHALAALVARHGALRSRAVRREDSYLVEELTHLPVELPVTDLSTDTPASPENDSPDRVTRWCREHASVPFAMDQAPLFRFRLARRGPDRWTLLTVLHHAVCDGWSLGILWRDLTDLYHARLHGHTAQLPPSPVQFTDIAHAEHDLSTERRTRLERFWRSELDGTTPALTLPYDHPRPPALSGRGAVHTQHLDDALSTQLSQTAGLLGTTPYAVLAGVFALWAARRRHEATTDQHAPTGSDLVLTASTANRLGPGREEVVGLLGDAVPLRARLGDADTFADLAHQLSATLYTALDHQDLPLRDIVQLLDPALPTGLVPNALFTVVTTPPPALELERLACTVSALPTHGVARTELYVVVSPHDQGLSVTFEYSTDLFTPATIETWSTELVTLLREFLDDPHHPLPHHQPTPPRTNVLSS